MAGRVMMDFIDYYGRPFQIDAALRVRVRGRGEGYLDGNVHTFRGRFTVWYPDLGDGLATSLSEIESMTEEARIWITGYLAGSEPPMTEYLGIDDDDDATEEEFQRWTAFCRRFRETGYCPPLDRRPGGELKISDDERAEILVDPWRPKVIAGERVWVPSGSTWAQADPQPEIANGQLVDTLCARREHHDLMDLASGWTVCLDCDQVTVNN
jgi:hypothetical protein